MDQPMIDRDRYTQQLLSAVTGLTAEMCRAASREDVLSLAATWIPQIIPASRASIAFPTDDRHLAVHALEGDKAIPIGLSLPINATTTGRAYRERRCVLTPDTSKRSEDDCQMLAGKGLVTCINAPLISRDDVIGTLNVAHWKEGIYTDEHASLLEHVAGVVAAQLNLLDRFFSTQERLEAMVAERTRELEAQKVRLQIALDKEKDLNGLQRKFVSMVSHEFRTPLSIIDGSAQRMIRRHDKIGAEKMLCGLGKIRTSVSRLTDLIEDALSVTWLENGGARFEPQSIDLRAVIGELCQAVSGDEPGSCPIGRHEPSACGSACRWQADPAGRLQPHLECRQIFLGRQANLDRWQGGGRRHDCDHGSR